ncbi:MAG: alpha/beta hydrolase family protein [Fervidobacterium sp.]
MNYTSHNWTKNRKRNVKIPLKSQVKNELVVLLKIGLYVFSLVISFPNLLIFLLILLVLNIPLIRKSVFGRLALDPKKPTWAYRESVKYSNTNYLDIFYPKLERNEIPKGVVLFAHGGGWISGYRRQPNNLSWYRYLVKEGFIVAAIDYSRGYKADIEILINELVDAVEFIKKYLKKDSFFLSSSDHQANDIEHFHKFSECVNERMNVMKISLMGLSAGGHLALLTASKLGEEISKVVAYYTPCDLMDIWNSTSIFARLALTSTIKRFPSKNKGIYEKYSPVNNINESFPNILLVHGLKDSVVPYISSVKMHKKMREKGKKCKLLLHPYGNHGFEFVLKDKKTIEILKKTVQFLEG